MNVNTQRYALALDLVDDEAKIAAYEKAHESIWPEVREHLLAQGVLGMEIYRLGTRMFMVMEVDPKVYSETGMAQASLNNEAIVRWETLMWTFQAPTPWTPEGQKWVPMRRIFQLR
ncbi:L-rhamnose mutarotase [Rhodoferax mekongensis]|uniref:L-rhamnose mutarotase n=1 Tax=Rhodoferax mekongensis TaxID=3068341 RepID=UPI0028BE8D3C|nr:L-rhamnose mutarotase [Rhodoferax sp. TBRC 17199]MDT7515617.1 L-rhamnose mutarotase [Rhodoferax sp. TBRC 17199]